MTPYEIAQGESPVILAIPHCGTHVPAEIYGVLNATGSRLADTDWHIDDLYRGLLPKAAWIRANFHRYVIDANRDPAGTSLYPGQNTTDLCPTTDFDGKPIWKAGRKPDSEETRRRLQTWHRPYHEGLQSLIERTRQQHGYAIVYDCHSIRSHIPFLFEGKLPDLNIGTNGGASCARILEQTAVGVCQASPFSLAVNGRFKGGWTTRRYGQPAKRVHAIQMEIAQSTYMNEMPPWTYRPDLASTLRVHLTQLLKAIEKAGLQGI